MKSLKIGDIILIAFLIVLTLFFIFFNTKKGEKAIIEADGTVIKVLDLSHDSQFVYEGKYKNTIMVKNGSVFVSDSDCPDKSCIHSGKLSSGSKIICCLPNKLIIRIANRNEKVDVISG